MRINHFKYASLYVVAMIIIFVTVSCNSGKKSYSAALLLGHTEQSAFVESIIRYAGHLPPRADHQTKHLPEYDDFYKNLASRHSLQYLYIDTEDTHYFLLTRPAPSLYDKETAIGGIVRYNGIDGIIYYEEVFRTWKMEKQELLRKSEMLFDLMVKGEDLTPYYPENSGDEEYIEFPNDFTRFDPDTRIWISDLFIPSRDIH